ncbi:MAG: hypothetical protein QNI87_02760 [Erythrobacter sp.]|uniref:hypothetical protein n=1 Tax=Erythrobacter sp. TaxID=1042 RepID=UPI0026018C57|nr:hypothetical protein [Erythrobacter sp.]MDJ0977432.1 hypothetical protein [Erythrobacter sp.]
MKTSSILLLTAVAVLAAAAPIVAQEGRPLRTLPHGAYQCALPGDADGLAFEPVETESFLIIPGSAYRDAQGQRGLYLLRGNELIFTSGPKKGQRFERVGDNTVQRVEVDGALGRLRCTRLAGTG